MLAEGGDECRLFGKHVIIAQETDQMSECVQVCTKKRMLEGNERGKKISKLRGRKETFNRERFSFSNKQSPTGVPIRTLILDDSLSANKLGRAKRAFCYR